jgi:hypothetical protein
MDVWMGSRDGGEQWDDRGRECGQLMSEAVRLIRRTGFDLHECVSSGHPPAVEENPFGVSGVVS